MIISDLPKLFDELCVKLGICLDPESRARLSITEFQDIDSFEVAVLRAEGLDPVHTDRKLRHALREYISRYSSES